MHVELLGFQLRIFGVLMVAFKRHNVKLSVALISREITVRIDQKGVARIKVDCTKIRAHRVTYDDG